MKQLIRLDKDWIPNVPGYSLYIRPAMSACRAMSVLLVSHIYPQSDANLPLGFPRRARRFCSSSAVRSGRTTRMASSRSLCTEPRSTAELPQEVCVVQSCFLCYGEAHDNQALVPTNLVRTTLLVWSLRKRLRRRATCRTYGCTVPSTM